LHAPTEGPTCLKILPFRTIQMLHFIKMICMHERQVNFKLVLIYITSIHTCSPLALHQA